MLGKPRLRLNNLKTSQRFPCLGLNLITDSISPMGEKSVSQEIRCITKSNFISQKKNKRFCSRSLYLGVNSGMRLTYVHALTKKNREKTTLKLRDVKLTKLLSNMESCCVVV